MAVNTVKIQIIKPIEDEWETFGKALRDVQYQSWKLANLAIQMFWDFNNVNYSYKERYGEYLNLKEKPLPNGKNGYKRIEGDILNVHKQHINKINGDGKDALIKMVSDKWKSDFKEILKGERSIPYFKKNIPIELHNKQFKNYKGEILMYKEKDQYLTEISLISREFAKQLGKEKTSFKVLLAVNDNYQKAIVDRIITGEYKLGMSKILYDKRKKKWFLSLAYTSKPKKKSLNKDRIMGIDLGINIPIMLAINDNADYQCEVGNTGEIDGFRKQIELRRKKLLQQSKWAGEGRCGHGVKTKIKPIDKLSKTIENFKNTKNHAYSKCVVNEALKNECGTIQMENLKGISQKYRFLKDWTYFDLQEKIKYKAEEHGIHVVLIKPNHTSQRCNTCGHIQKENRKDQARFVCMKCGFESNADWNAAKNIAIKNIDKIIERYINNQNEQINQEEV